VHLTKINTNNVARLARADSLTVNQQGQSQISVSDWRNTWDLVSRRNVSIEEAPWSGWQTVPRYNFTENMFLDIVQGAAMKKTTKLQYPWNIT